MQKNQALQLILLKQFKDNELNLMTLAKLPVEVRFEFAVELLVFLRFEPQHLKHGIQVVKRLLPQTPKNERLFVLKEIDQVIEDCNACVGKNSTDHLDVNLLMALTDEQRFLYAKHQVQRLNPQQVVVSEAALWSLVWLCPLLNANQKRELIPKVLKFIQTRTLPDSQITDFLQTVCVKASESERYDMLQCWVDFVLQNASDEKLILLFFGVVQSLDQHLTPDNKNTILQSLAVLFEHSHRKVVERLLQIYERAVQSLPTEYKFEHLNAANRAFGFDLPNFV